MRAMALGVSGAHAKPVEVIIQERLGTYRSGKGSTMNTAMAFAARSRPAIGPFLRRRRRQLNTSWIDGAESGRPARRRRRPEQRPTQ